MKRPWIQILIALMLGELVGYYLERTEIYWLGILCIFCFIYIYSKLSLGIIKIPFIFILLSCFCLGFGRMYILEQEKLSSPGMIRDKIIITKIVEEKEKVKIYGKDTLVYIDREKYAKWDLKLGQTIFIQGKSKHPKKPSNPGEFNAYLYYRSIGVKRIVFAKEIQILDKRVDRLKQFLYQIRKKGIQQLEKIFVDKEAGFVNAVLLGERTKLDMELYQNMQSLGISHLLAISGLHISMIGLCIYYILRKRFLVNFFYAGFFSSIFLFLYGILVGESVSVIRAISMLVMVFIAEWLGRSYDIVSALSVSGVIILCLSPYQIFQMGFLLSFGAVLAIGVPAKYFIQFFNVYKKNGDRYKFLESIIVSIMIQIITVPIIAYHLFAFSPYSILLNLLVIPLMGLFICSVILALGISFISLKLGIFVGGLAHYIIQFLYGITKCFISLPFAQIQIGRPSIYQIIIYYSILLLCGYICKNYLKIYNFIIKNNRDSFKRCKIFQRIWKRIINIKMEYRYKEIFKIKYLRHLYGILVLVNIHIFSICLLLPISDIKTKIYYMDIGQGDSIFIQSGRENILMDSGSTSNLKAGEYILEPMLKSLGIKKLDRVFLSHADQDHTNAFLYLVEQKEIEIGGVYLPFVAEWVKEYQYIIKCLELANIPIYLIESGYSFQTSKGEFQCLSPIRGKEEREINEQSLVFFYKEGDFKALFTGDAGKISEKKILETEKLQLEDITVLKIGHHGSYTASSEEFIRYCSPQYAMISYAKGNHYGHPHLEVIKRLQDYKIKTYETAKHGAILVVTDGFGLKIRTYGNE